MASDRAIQLTSEGMKRLEAELAHIREIKLPELTVRMHDLTEAGDITDSSEFENLKEEAATTEARALDLESTIGHAEIVPEGSKDGTIALGSHVVIRADDGIEESWVLVGPEEADAPEGRLSMESPVGQSIVGLKKGGSSKVTTPGGEITYEIVSVK
jgi:transcription elongation factor GreA